MLLALRGYKESLQLGGWELPGPVTLKCHWLWVVSGHHQKQVPWTLVLVLGSPTLPPFKLFLLFFPLRLFERG